MKLWCEKCLRFVEVVFAKKRPTSDPLALPVRDLTCLNRHYLAKVMAPPLEFTVLARLLACETKGEDDETFCYVAVYPERPEAAFAAAFDNPEECPETEKQISDWLKGGALVRRVPYRKALEMMAAHLAMEQFGTHADTQEKK